MTTRSEQIIEMYRLVYGYTEEEATVRLGLFEAEVLTTALIASRGMNPTHDYARSRLTARRREWWIAGVAQVQKGIERTVRELQSRGGN